MEPSTIATLVIAVVTARLPAAYPVRCRHQAPDGYVPGASWLQAGIYCAFYLVATLTRLVGALMSTPAASPGQLHGAGRWSIPLPHG